MLGGRGQFWVGSCRKGTRINILYSACITVTPNYPPESELPTLSVLEFRVREGHGSEFWCSRVSGKHTVLF